MQRQADTRPTSFASVSSPTRPWLAALAVGMSLLLAACQTTPQQQRTLSTAPDAGAVVTADRPAAERSYSLALAPGGTAVARAPASIVIDAASGAVLHESRADELRYPASLSKMMTLYLLFDAVSAGQLSMETPLNVSAEAARQPPAKIGVRAGTTITVRQAVSALAVRSANDVAVVVAEALAGSEQAFAARMTAKARRLGMRRTVFVNASGLPDPRQVTTARDMSILSRSLQSRHAAYARYFSARSFTYQGRRFDATNNLLGRVAGVDGIKTGYIRMSGYNLAASARRNGRRVIAVVFGGESEGARDREVTALLEQYL